MAAEPLFKVRLVVLPVTVLDVEAPTVIMPLVVVMVRVPLPPNAISPLRVTSPELVLILPAFQVNGPFTVNAALVELAAARSWPKVIVLVEVKITGSLKLRLP